MKIDHDVASSPRVPPTEALIHAELPWIRQRLRALFPAHLDLDELEQKVLLNVARGLPNFRGEGSLRAWLDRITVRVGLKHARRARSRERHERALSESSSQTQQRSPADTYFARRQVQGLLALLPLEQECAVVLHHVIGLEVAEVPADQGVPDETARSRLRVGSKKLRSRARVRESALP